MATGKWGAAQCDGEEGPEWSVPRRWWWRSGRRGESWVLGGICRVLAGMPTQMGATALTGGFNFSVYSRGTTANALYLFTLNLPPPPSSGQTQM